ncbi:MAG: hypothetical protein Q9220_006825 [cf. Caloplaca sp. 1 TL-2023]
MPSSEALTDEYLAQLLAKDAKDKANKYSSYGLQSFLPRRPTTNAPKPNTRFLKNIIKETDSHNAALRAKEIADARARLQARLRHQEDPTHTKTQKSEIQKEEDAKEATTMITLPMPAPMTPDVVAPVTTIVTIIAVNAVTAEAHLQTQTAVEDGDQDTDTDRAHAPNPLPAATADIIVVLPPPPHAPPPPATTTHHYPPPPNLPRQPPHPPIP